MSASFILQVTECSVSSTQELGCDTNYSLIEITAIIKQEFHFITDTSEHATVAHSTMIFYRGSTFLVLLHDWCISFLSSSSLVVYQVTSEVCSLVKVADQEQLDYAKNHWIFMFSISHAQHSSIRWIFARREVTILHCWNNNIIGTHHLLLTLVSRHCWLIDNFCRVMQWLNHSIKQCFMMTERGCLTGERRELLVYAWCYSIFAV